ncbi:MAG: adenosylmethionine decarboxylase [Deltaproteobacteria bacterium]|nr:adenosylmethionine decarboxylase [Deltaproteobacteria bacterium]MBW2072174.1 adenosylmethionine decarboxylase [Deltaproteobacteria bacterium]
MKSLGTHLIIELFQCDRATLDDPETLQHHLLEAVTLSGATPIQPFFHQFSPHGVSGIVVIAESHFSLHTWPEYGYCALDIFTCGEQIDGYLALSRLKQALGAQHVAVTEIKRGVLDLPHAEIKHKPYQEPT